MDILSAVYKHNMFASGDLVLVAVSGGPDSVAMLHALHTRSKELGISLHVAHLNHGIRGEQSNLDEDFLRKLTHEFRLPCTIKRVDVPALMKETGMGEEEAAREIRHKFLQETYTQLSANKIVIGHTADDRAETVLLNLIRGSGIDGLGAMRAVSGNIVRPLIDAARADIEAYIAENALPYRIDESNADTSYTRNRIRHDLIPLLEGTYNPQIKKALTRMAEIAEAERDLIDGLVSPAIRHILYGGSIDVGLFLELPIALQRRVLRDEIGRVKGDTRDVEFEQIERVIESLREGKDFSITLPSGEIYAVRAGDKFKIVRKRKNAVITPFCYALTVPGRAQIPEIETIIEATIENSPKPRKTRENEILIDETAIKGRLFIRNNRPGDRIIPFGMSQPKKLQDIFVDAKIQKNERSKIAVVVDDEKLLWVVGHAASEAVRVTERTKQAIRLNVTGVD